MLKILFLNLLKAVIVFLLMICAIGFSIDENVSSTVRFILAPLFSILLLFFFHKWLIKPLLLKAKSTKKIQKSRSHNVNSYETYVDSLTRNPMPTPASVPTAEKKPFHNRPVVVWSGTTKPVSFRILSEKERREGIFTQLEIHKDGDFYFYLADQSTGEITLVKEREIQSRIKINSQTYDFVELCIKVLKIDLSDLFEQAKEIRKAANEPYVIAKFSPITTSFTYLSSNGKERRTVDIDQVLKNDKNDYYLSGFCHLRKERRTFISSRFQTMLVTEGHKKYYFHDWLKNVIGIDYECS
ncbi:WYL domain-containing protein [Salmonella enterica]|nr:WYL domain-containing protein [Salmonella enterica]